MGVDAFELEVMTLAELRDLKARVDDAIRAQIRAQRLSKERVVTATEAKPAQTPDDLVRERDAWLSNKQ